MDTTGSISASEALRHLGQDSCPRSLTRGLLKKPKCMHSRRSGASRHREAILRGVAAGRFYPVLAAAERAALCSDAALMLSDGRSPGPACEALPLAHWLKGVELEHPCGAERRSAEASGLKHAAARLLVLLRGRLAEHVALMVPHFA